MYTRFVNLLLINIPKSILMPRKFDRDVSNFYLPDLDFMEKFARNIS